MQALGKNEVLAEFRIQDTTRSEIDKDLMIDKFLYSAGLSQSLSDVLVRYHRSLPAGPSDKFPIVPVQKETEIEKTDEQ